MTTNPFYPHYRLGDPLQYLYPPSPRPRYAGGSRAARRHLIGLDILHAVWVGLEDVKGMDKPRRRLATLITRARRAMGDYSQLGGWSFANRKDFTAYQRSLNGLIAAILRMPEITDGLCWLIVGAGWAVDLHDEAKAAGRTDLVRVWRPIVNLMDGLFRLYDGEDWAEASWEPGKQMLADLKKESGTWA